MEADRKDDELLQLAAEAAGLPLAVHWRGYSIAGVEPLALWDPLTDDGDALRLAVKLRMSIVNYPHSVAAIHSSEAGHITKDERLGKNPYAATRRAIVRAAAAIGDAARTPSEKGGQSGIGGADTGSHPTGIYGRGW